MDKEMARLERIYKLLEADEACGNMQAECEAARKQFESFTNALPEGLRELLWRYPGSQYFLHHWMLRLVCQYMRFPDETE